MGTHGLGRFNESNIALDGVGTYPLNPNALLCIGALGDCAKRNKVACRRGIGLDIHIARGAQFCAGRNREPLPSIALYFHPKAR